MDMNKFDASMYTENEEAEKKFNSIVAEFTGSIPYFINRELIIVISRTYDKFQDNASQTLDANFKFQGALETIKVNKRDINNHTSDELLNLLDVFDNVKKELKIETEQEIYFEAALRGSGEIGSSYRQPRTEEDRKEEKLNRFLYL
ncbi:MAG: hypothetical protein WC875_02990 [Candidatus Absconditabacterales bacterium]